MNKQLCILPTISFALLFFILSYTIAADQPQASGKACLSARAVGCIRSTYFYGYCFRLPKTHLPISCEYLWVGHRSQC